MRRAFLARFKQSLFLLFLSLLVGLPVSKLSASQDLLIESSERRFKLEAERRDGDTYYRLSELAASVGCKLETQDQTAILTGPAGTLHLADGRALIRLSTEYILLSSAPWRDQEDQWYVAEDFVARALPLVLKESLRPAGSKYYRLGSVSTEMELELINRPDQVRLIFRPQRYTPISILEYSDRIEVALGSSRIEIQFPPVQPNQQIVASVSQNEGFLILRKGPRFDRFEESQPASGSGSIIDLFGIPSSIVRLPPRSSPSPDTPSRGDEKVEQVDSEKSGQLQDWRWGPIDRRRSSVVIDPGHGGHDLGVSQDGLMEKNITLEVALQIQGMLERAGYTCQLTRTRDVSLPIEKRSGIANYYQPRVFVSIHTGGAPSASTRSSAVYIHNRPNSVSQQERQQATRGTPREELTLWSEAQSPYQVQSNTLGHLIQQHLEALTERTTVFAKAPLAVLSSIEAPAVLVEIGYLTNPSQRKELQSKYHRDLIAQAIAESIVGFLNDSTGDLNAEEK